ncbi:MAG: type II secretion system protein [Candidatus Berkelbacteria bacterium]|nr:type II secretion system protein [Candidatus Berkelbacteria bacterium]
MQRKAFTLIELLVVISIIGILVSISVVGWVSVSQRGRDSTRKSDLARIKQVLQQQYSDTRTYPVFEINSAGVIYSATWQLTKNGGEGCDRTDASAKLSSKYIGQIPTDPKDSFSYSSATCSNLAKDQGDRYLYITPTDANGPITNPTSFGLMATLEQSQSDRISDPKLNPLDLTYNGPVFGNWYSSKNNYVSPNFVTANYLVDNKGQ